MSDLFDADTRATLAALLRARPTTAEQLQHAAPLPLARFRPALERLEAAGFIERDDDEVRVLAPEEVLAARAARLLDEDRAADDDLVALLHRLPGLGREWDHVAHGGTAPMPIDVVHGTRNQWELWMRLMSEAPPRAPLAAFPDFGGLAGFVLENGAALEGAAATFGFRIRTLARAEELADPTARGQVERFATLGLEVRTLPALPSWFYVDAGVMAAMPLAWGEAVPTSVVLVREPALVAALAAFGERMWTRARRLPSDAAGWDPVLELLAQGLSDAAVASALGQSVRTVRRRIADAAEAYGVGSRFELGVEWARRS
jgi:hypothetical protein